MTIHAIESNTGKSEATGAADEYVAGQVRSAVRSKKMDRFIIEAVLDSYLLELVKADVVAANEMMSSLENDDKFASMAHQAVFDGLMFSTLVGTLDDLAFSAALEEIEPLRNEPLETLRQAVFDHGLKVACLSVGGSPQHGKALRRSEMFKDVSGISQPG